jgi:dihydroorotate dehydrogenase (NAD+) catalytic subunit
MVIDTETMKPVLANVTGGLTGPAIHTVAVKLVWEAAKAVDIPVIGMGGITNSSEAMEFILAGASAVAVGTANFSDPMTSIKVAEGMAAYIAAKGWSSMSEAVGAAAR